MKKILLSFSVLVAVAFSACTKSNNTPSTNASVMFVHGCAAGATTINVDGRVNDVTVTGAANMAFLKGSGYQTVPAGSNVALSFFVTGLDSLTGQAESLSASSYYTAFAGGSITSPSFVFALDDLSAPTSGNAKVRFVNLSPDNLVTSCYIGTVKIDSNVGYKTCTSFFEVAATTGSKVSMIDQVTLSNSGAINSQALTAGKIYTFMFTGTATGTGSSVLTLTVINNN